jgi:GNAT superfamily N-acetyltransferase
MSITLRQPMPADGPAVQRLVFEAFASIHDRHQFPRDFPTLESAGGLANAWLNHPKVWGVLAERDRKIVGCNFLDHRNSVPAVGPVCVDPKEQGGGIGRMTMEAVIEHGRQMGAKSIRLCQDAFNTASMSLYTSVGFNVNEPLVLFSGKATAAVSPGANVRPMREGDLPACGDLCRRIHGFDRNGELVDCLKMVKPFVVERDGELTAYLAAPSFYVFNHAVAQTPQDMKDLIAGASAQAAESLVFLVPTRNSEFFRWCLAQRLRVVKPMTLMTWGEYRDPRGWWCPSVEY